MPKKSIDYLPIPLGDKPNASIELFIACTSSVTKSVGKLF